MKILGQLASHPKLLNGSKLSLAGNQNPFGGTRFGFVYVSYDRGYPYSIIDTYTNTANISTVKIIVFRHVQFPAVIPLYYLHLITALSTVEKCKHRFTVVYYKIYTFTW